MREKRYDEDMKGTQGKEEERKEKVKEKIRGVFCRSWSRIEGNGKRELYNAF